MSSFSARFPAGVERGLHLCYGDYKHRHFHAPEDLSVCVELANGVGAPGPRSSIRAIPHSVATSNVIPPLPALAAARRSRSSHGSATASRGSA